MTGAEHLLAAISEWETVTAPAEPTTGTGISDAAVITIRTPDTQTRIELTDDQAHRLATLLRQDSAIIRAHRAATRRPR